MSHVESHRSQFLPLASDTSRASYHHQLSRNNLSAILGPVNYLRRTTYSHRDRCFALHKFASLHSLPKRQQSTSSAIVLSDTSTDTRGLSVLELTIHSRSLDSGRAHCLLCQDTGCEMRPRSNVMFSAGGDCAATPAGYVRADLPGSASHLFLASVLVF